MNILSQYLYMLSIISKAEHTPCAFIQQSVVEIYKDGIWFDDVNMDKLHSPATPSISLLLCGG